MKAILILFMSTIYIFGLDFSSIKTFEAKFVQTIVNPSGKVLKYNGDIFILKPNNILWKYKTPIVKNVYINGNFVIIDEPELEQAIYTRTDQEINLFDMLNNAKLIEENHYITELNNIKYNIYTKENKIDHISYVDTLENKVNIVFTDAIYNQHIDDKLFVFNAPQEYDIIRK